MYMSNVSLTMTLLHFQNYFGTLITACIASKYVCQANVILVFMSLMCFTHVTMCAENFDHVDDESPNYSPETFTAMQTQYITQTSLVPISDLEAPIQISVQGKSESRTSETTKWPFTKPVTHPYIEPTTLSTLFGHSYQISTTDNDMFRKTSTLVTRTLDKTLGLHLSTTMPTVIDACEVDQSLVISTNHIFISATTNDRLPKCSILITSGNTTVLSIKILSSSFKTFFSYFYVELLDEQCARRYILVSDDIVPCAMMIGGKQFRFHFQNTDMLLELHAEAIEMPGCVENQLSAEGQKCGIVTYDNVIKQKLFEQKKQFTFGKPVLHWHGGFSTFLTAPSTRINYTNVYKTFCMVTRYLINHDCTSLQYSCTLGHREWVCTCMNVTITNLVVFKPHITGLSFSNSYLFKIQALGFDHFTRLKCLFLDKNNIESLPVHLWQKLRHLEVVDLRQNFLTYFIGHVSFPS